MIRAIVLVSGGLDSAVSLWWALRQGWTVIPLTFGYHARPSREIEATGRLVEQAGLQGLITIPLPFLKEVVDWPQEGFGNGPLKGYPEGYIPSRNLIYYSLAAYHAEIFGARWIVGGHNRRDRELFPDASPRFFEELNRLWPLSLWSYSRIPLQVVLPLIDMTKPEVLRLAFDLGVPLATTWSCYSDGDSPCGQCESCRERAEAFRALGGNDPAYPARASAPATVLRNRRS